MVDPHPRPLDWACQAYLGGLKPEVEGHHIQHFFDEFELISTSVENGVGKAEFKDRGALTRWVMGPLLYHINNRSGGFRKQPCISFSPCCARGVLIVHGRVAECEVTASCWLWSAVALCVRRALFYSGRVLLGREVTVDVVPPSANAPVAQPAPPATNVQRSRSGGDGGRQQGGPQQGRGGPQGYDNRGGG